MRTSFLNLSLTLTLFLNAGLWAQDAKIKTMKKPMKETQTQKMMTEKKVKLQGTGVSYVANHGFMISNGPQKVMIDTLFTTNGDTYACPSDELLKGMITESGPFEGANMLLTTHGHGDHFNAKLTAKYLNNNPKALWICPQEVAQEVQQHENDPALLKRIIGLDLKPGSRIHKTIAGVDLEVISIPHHLNDNMQHLAYLVNMNDVKVLHLGDAAKKPEEMYQKLALAESDIDVLIAPCGSDCSNWMVNANGDGPAVICNQIKPKHLVMGHLPNDLDKAQIKKSIIAMRTSMPDIQISLLNQQPLNQTVFFKKEGQLVAKHIGAKKLAQKPETMKDLKVAQSKKK